MSKRRIFEIYLNVIEWGNGVFGAEAAARHYYGVSAAQLTSGAGGEARRDGAESALLRPASIHRLAGAQDLDHPGADAGVRDSLS